MISAVIVNYKSFMFLPALIDSLKKERVEEIIVIDNSMDEEERKKIENLSGISPYFLKENKGLSYALNFGAKKSNGTLLLFCNPDLLFKEGSIDNLKKEMGKCDASGPLIFWDEEEEICLPYPFPLSFWNEFIKILFPKFFQNIYLKYEFKIWKSTGPKSLPLLSGSCFLIKRDIFEKVGGFDENFFLYFEENDFFKRFKNMGFKSNFVPSSKIIHFYNLNKNPIHNKYFEESKKLYEKKYLNLPKRIILKFLKKFVKRKEKKFQEIMDEKIEDFPLILSPFPSFIPSVYVKKARNWVYLNEKLKEILFFEGYIGLFKENSILKSFHFKVK